MQSAVLLDGGLGQEIYRRAHDVSSPLWSVAVMLEQPDVVAGVHEDFIRAGARTLSLNTYPATPTRLRHQGMLDQLEVIHQQAFAVLEQAIEATGADVDIAGCLGPLVGSYQAQPDRSFEDLKAEYDLLVQLQSRADVMLIETMTNALEASAACAAAQALGKPYGVAIRLEDDGRLKSGESLEQAVAAVKAYNPTAVMLNCCDPEVLTEAMPGLASLYPVVGGYANAFTTVEPMARGESVDLLEARSDVSPQAYTECVRLWLQGGASVVGGCCEITPSHIGDIANVLGADYEFIKFSELQAGR